MSNTGKQLEGLVAFVEEVLLPKGFTVKTNQCIYDDDGVQVAEFDVQVRGRVGSTEIAWLIECRDRPGSGPAPGSWIEQLVGRRSRFGFNKVTAVSTTGFSKPAEDFARTAGIETREVTSLVPEQFSDWLGFTEFRSDSRMSALHHARLLVAEEENESKRKALAEILSELRTNAPILKSTKTGEFSSINSAFTGATTQKPEVFAGLEPNGPGRKVRLRVEYSNPEDCFVVETGCGDIRIMAIVFRGELSLISRVVPVASTSEYRREDGSVISKCAGFEPIEVGESHFAIELHRVEESGETHVLMRKVGQSK